MCVLNAVCKGLHGLDWMSELDIREEVGAEDIGDQLASDISYLMASSASARITRVPSLNAPC
jgi:hypothetical protein